MIVSAAVDVQGAGPAWWVWPLLAGAVYVGYVFLRPGTTWLARSLAGALVLVVALVVVRQPRGPVVLVALAIVAAAIVAALGLVDRVRAGRAPAAGGVPVAPTEGLPVPVRGRHRRV